MNMVSLTRRRPAWLAITLIITLVTTLAGCASAPTRAPNSEARSQERWDLQTSGDLAGAYAYLSPGYRSSVSLLQYQRSIMIRKIGITAAEVRSSDCLEDVCNVKVLLDFTLIAPIPGMNRYDGNQVITEDWVYSEGNWWLVPEK